MAAKSATLSVMNRTFLLLVATVLVFVAGPCESEARTWTRASDGAKIEGEFVRMKDATTVFIRRDSGAVVEVPLAMLVAEDQAAIKELAATPSAPAKTAPPTGETEVTLTDVHLCCGGCRRGVERAASGFDVEVSTSGKSVTVKGEKGSEVQKALDAIAEAGFYGNSDHDTVKIADVAAGDSESSKVKVSGVHLCCESCVKAVNEALSSVSGFQEHDAEDGADSFEVSGEGLKAGEIVAALRAKGLNGTVR